jgi:undecaprenyl-diphosphatase
MDHFYLFVLALIQGITEFLPVSSSAHLELLHKFVGSTEDDLALDVAVHIGTLGAVILYFWTDVKQALVGTGHLLIGKTTTPHARLALCLIIATIPVVIAGLILKVTELDETLRSLATIGWAMILFGIVLWWFDRKPIAAKTSAEWNFKDAITLGLWQAIALIPGASRSGVTITGALALGYTRTEAARISMLMSIPTIIASGMLLGADVASDANWDLAKAGLVAAIFAFGAALLALSLMMRLLKTISFTPYVIYRMILGTILLWIAYT